MARLLFVVARERGELLSHLSHEFPDGDVGVVVDRRQGDRRERGRPEEAASTSAERRGTDRRGVHASAQELRAIGYSIIPLEEPLSFAAARYPVVSATAVREAEGYLRDRFRYYTAIPSWDRVFDGQAFVLLSPEGRTVHRVVFTREFLDYYGARLVDRVPGILDEWKLPQHLEQAGRQRVVVSMYGISSADA